MSKDNDEFGRDDVLDYMVYEDIEKEIKGKSCKSGCLGILIILVLPFIILRHFFEY